MTEIPMTKTRLIKTHVKNCPFHTRFGHWRIWVSNSCPPRRVNFVFRASDFVFMLTYSVRNGMTFLILILIDWGGFGTIEGINKGEQFRDDYVQIRRNLFIDVKL
jgi:hypothetical protein